MNTLITLIHLYEDAKVKVAELTNERTSLDRSLAKFAAVDRYAPKVLTSASNLNAWNLEQGNSELETMRIELFERLVAFDTTTYDARLTAEITQLESAARDIHPIYNRADNKVKRAKKNGWAVPKDAIRTVENLRPRITEICDLLNGLYQLKEDRYELVKYFLMLDSLKERSQQKDQPVGTTQIKFLGTVRTAKRSRTCKGKRFKNKPRKARRPKPVQSEKSKKVQQGKKRGQKQAA